MAETVHLFLKANGADIQGEPTQTSLDRANSIECVYFESGTVTAREASSGRATGKRQHEPILIRKRIDKSSVLMSKALCNNSVIEGEFRFYRPNPNGDGTTEMFFKVKIGHGRIASQKLWVPDSLVPATSTEPPLEEIKFVFGNIEWTYTNGGITHADSHEANT